MNIGSIQGIGAGHRPMSADDPRLKSAAHEFEASLMQEFLKPLQQDSLFAPENSDGTDGSLDMDGSGDADGSSSALMSFGSEALAKAISERGGFGIATKILNHFRTQNPGEGSVNASKI